MAEEVEIDRPMSETRVRRDVPMTGVAPTTVVDARPVFLRRASWGAIFAAVFTILSVQMLLTVLGMAIGLSLVEPTATEAVPEQMGVAAGIWWIVSGVIALFLGGWIGGRLAGSPSRTDGALHGLAAWAVATVLGAYLVFATGTAVVGGATTMLQTSAQVGAAAEDDIDWNRIEQRMEEMLARQEAGTVGQPTITEEDVEETSADVADTAAGTAWWTFIALILGVAAATVGGWAGAPAIDEEDLADRRARRM